MTLRALCERLDSMPALTFWGLVALVTFGAFALERIYRRRNS